MFVTVYLQGGIGNQLFQLAFLEYVSKRNNIPGKITTVQSPGTVHSNTNYFQSILKNWIAQYTTDKIHNTINEDNISLDLLWSSNTMYHGYFQDFKYTDEIRNTFIPKLLFDTQILSKYPDIKTKFFIHVRGGDYLNKGMEVHNINLTAYYNKCLELCQNEEFVVFTNDKEYTNNIFGNKFQIIDESEIDTLYLMSQCKGCICANSSFSWWGAYFNPNRRIYMPSKWFNDPSVPGNYYFNGVTVVDINV
jgi:hypothetical protein